MRTPQLPWLIATLLPMATWGALILPSGHMDVTVNLQAGTWSAGLKLDEEEDTLVLPNLLIFGTDEDWDGTGSQAGWTSRPAGSDWDFLGGDDGDPVYVFPQGGDKQGQFPWLGFSSDETGPGALALRTTDDPRAPETARWMSIELVGVRFTDAFGAPGAASLSLWQSGSFGIPTIWWSTAMEPLGGNQYWMLEGSHSHLNWGFTEKGFYEIDFRASGISATSGQPVVGNIETLRVGIGVSSIIPEPNTLLLCLFGVCLLKQTKFLNQA